MRAGMELEELVGRSLSLAKPWKITSAELVEDTNIVEIHVTYKGKMGPCPECGKICKQYDMVERRWRHLDILHCQSWVVCQVPRVRCEEHKVKRIDVPWSDGWALSLIHI